MDFTLKKYSQLLKAFQEAKYAFLTYSQYCEMQQSASLPTRFVVLRHDVDELAGNALKMARLENGMGITATYYFRIVKQSNNPEVIREIVRLQHEVGYHYEDLNTAQGDVTAAMKCFAENLAYFRTYYPVLTVCMHGSSSCKYDNRDLWKQHSLADFGLIGEPYLTNDFRELFYLTDTGSAWDGGKYAVRDVVENHFGLAFHATPQIVHSIQSGAFPEKCLILAHTLWTDSMAQWLGLHLREFLRNNVKRLAQRNKLIQRVYSKLVKSYWKQ